MVLPGSDGREPRERRKWLEINGVPSGSGFACLSVTDCGSDFLPLSWQGSESYCCCWFPAENRLRKEELVRASITSGLCVLGWILGVWAATGPDPEADSNAEIQNGFRGSVLLPAGCDGGCGFFCGGAAICYAVFSPSIGRIVEGERTVLEGAAEIVSKVLTVVCVIVPVWLAERARR